MTRGEFEQLVEEGMHDIPSSFRRYLEDVAVIVRARPTARQRRAARVRSGDLLFGLYEGTPHTHRQYLTYRLPDTITLFQEAFETTCRGDAACMREEVAETVWHELAHALGMSEAHVRRLEHRRKRPRRSSFI